MIIFLFELSPILQGKREQLLPRVFIPKIQNMLRNRMSIFLIILSPRTAVFGVWFYSKDTSSIFIIKVVFSLFHYIARITTADGFIRKTKRYENRMRIFLIILSAILSGKRKYLQGLLRFLSFLIIIIPINQTVSEARRSRIYSDF